MSVNQTIKTIHHPKGARTIRDCFYLLSAPSFRVTFSPSGPLIHILASSYNPPTAVRIFFLEAMPSNGVGKFRTQALWSEGVIVKSKINTKYFSDVFELEQVSL